MPYSRGIRQDLQLETWTNTNSPAAMMLRALLGRRSSGAYSRHPDDILGPPEYSIGLFHANADASNRAANFADLVHRIATRHADKLAKWAKYLPEMTDKEQLARNERDVLTSDWFQRMWSEIARQPYVIREQLDWWIADKFSEARSAFRGLGWTRLRGLALLARAENSSGRELNRVVDAAQLAQAQGLPEDEVIERAAAAYKGGSDTGQRRWDIIKREIPKQMTTSGAVNWGALNWGGLGVDGDGRIQPQAKSAGPSWVKSILTIVMVWGVTRALDRWAEG